MIAILIVFLAVNQKKESDEKIIKMRQRQDRDETVLLLASQQQGQPTLRCRCQSTGPVVKLLSPPSLYMICQTCHLSSTDASIVVDAVFVIIFLHLRLCHHRRSLGPVVDPSLPPLLFLIPRTRRLLFILCQRLCCCR